MADSPDTSGHRRLDAYFTVSLHVAERLARGEADAAIGVLRRELARTEDDDAGEGRGFLYALLAVCHGRSGDPEGTLGVLEEMERVLPDDAATALRLSEGYLLLLGDTDRAASWSRRAADLVGDGRSPDDVERRARAQALEARAAVQADRGDDAVKILAAAELPDPEVAEALLDAGASPEALGATLRDALPRHEAHERSGAAPSARSDEIRRLLGRIGGDP